MMRQYPISVATIACFLALISGPVRGQRSIVGADVSGGRSAPPSTSYRHVWTHPGAWWIGERVALGNNGTQVFTHYYLNDQAAALLSVHDGDPPAPAWELLTDPEDPVMVDSAASADVHVSITQTDTGTVNQRIIRVRKYSAQGLDWTYTYPHLTAGRLVSACSADGEVILAAIGNPTTSLNDVLVFGPDSPTPVASYTLPGGTLWSFDLAADGSRAVFGIHTTLYVIEVATGNALLTIAESPSFSNRGVAISGDGSVVAYGKFLGGLHLYEWNGSAYVSTWFHPTAGGVGVIDLSEDSSTAAYGVNFGYPSTRIITECVDVATKTVTMHEDISSYGQYQNTVYDVAISADGELFVTATFGDEPDLVEEVRVYQKHRDVPMRTLNLPGSAFNVDISPDGKWVVAGSKSIHANESGHGGQIDLLHLGGSDFAMHTTPSVGATVTFEVFGNPGSPALLLHSPALSTPPMVFPAIGTLYLARASMSVVPMGPIGSGGSASKPWTISGPVGNTHYFQGFMVSPRRLTDCWLPVTCLP